MSGGIQMKGIFEYTKEKEEYRIPVLEIYKFPVGSDVFLTLSEEEKNDNEFGADGLFGGN